MARAGQDGRHVAHSQPGHQARAHADDLLAEHADDQRRAEQHDDAHDHWHERRALENLLRTC